MKVLEIFKNDITWYIVRAEKKYSFVISVTKYILEHGFWW